MKQVKEENDNQPASLLTSKWLYVQTIITHNALISADTIDGNSTSWCIKLQRTLKFPWNQNQMFVSRSHCLRSNSNGTHRFSIAMLFMLFIRKQNWWTPECRTSRHPALRCLSMSCHHIHDAAVEVNRDWIKLDHILLSDYFLTSSIVRSALAVAIVTASLPVDCRRVRTRPQSDGQLQYWGDMWSFPDGQILVALLLKSLLTAATCS